jgi:adenylate kinase
MHQGSHVVVLLGPPGSGKGTQAARLSTSSGLPAISTGEILRREVASGSELGRQVQGLLAAGLLLGDDHMNEIVEKRLSADDCKRGCILDGYPRTLNQAYFLDMFLSRSSVARPLIFDFVLSPDEVIKRVSQRRQCPTCGKIVSLEFDIYGKDLTCDRDGTPLIRRADDNPSAIRERLLIYERNTRELVNYYKSQSYWPVQASQMPDAIALELTTILNSVHIRSLESAFLTHMR